MSETPTISQIVEQIIDSLSEAISELMMMVIILQERNADPPPALPNGVGIVTSSAERLHMVAMALAEEDYQEYPDIKQEIEEAAKAVSSSASDLTNSLQILMTSTDKVRGWEGLVQACKVMSAKTIRLLQIVYGAEREKLFRAAQKALDALNALDPTAARNGKEFAQKAGEAATQANQLAAYVRDKANDAPPQKKHELLGLADELNAGASKLINDANALLRDPANPNLQRNVANDLTDVKGTINRTVDALKDMDNQFNDADKEFENRSSAMKNSLRDLGQDKDSYDEDILFIAKKERNEMDNLLDDTDNGNIEGAKTDLDNSKLLNDKLSELVGLEANNETNPSKKKALENAKRELDQVYPNYKAAATNAINNPNNTNAMDSLDDAHDQLDRAIQKIVDLVSNPNAQIGASARKEIEDLNNLREATRDGDETGVGRAAKALIKENKTLTGLCANQADKMVDPLRKKLIQDGVDELQRLLPHELLSSKNALQNPSPETLKELEAKTRTMQDQVKSTAILSKDYPELDLLDAANKEKRLLNNIQKAAENGKPNDVNNFAPQLLNNTKLIGDIAREIAKKKPRTQQVKILDSVNKLDRLAGPTCNDAKKLASNPNNQEQKQQLGKKVDDMKALVDKIVADTDAALFRECLAQLGNLHNIKNCADENDTPGLANAAQETANRHKRLVPLAKQAAQRSDDQKRKNQLLGDVNELDNLLPKGIGQTNNFIKSPNDDNREKLRDTIGTMEDIVQGIADPSKYDPTIPRGQTNGGGDLARMLKELVDTAEYSARNPNDQKAKQRLLDILNNLPLELLDTDAERLANLIREQSKALDELCNNAENGNKQGVENAGRNMLDIQDKIKEQANKMLDKLLDPEKKKKVSNALDSLDNLIPSTINEARKVANNPRDQLAKKRMYDLADDVRDQLSILADNAISSKEQRLREAARLEKEALERLRKAVIAGDIAGANDALIDVKNYNNILAEEGRECAKEIRDPTLNKRILDTVSELEKLMPILDTDCREGASNPNNQRARAKAMEDIDKCKNLIDSLLRDTKADAIALAQIEDNTLTEMEQHVKSGSPDAANDVRKLIQTQKDLKEAAIKAAESLPNPRSKQNIYNALKELDQLLPLHVNNSKAVLQNLNDPIAKDKVGDSTTRMKAPLAQIIATLRPTPENIADANRKREAALLAQLREAARNGDTQETERLLPEIKGINDRLVNLARTEAGKSNIPEKRKELEDAANDLENLEKQLAPIARNAANNPNNAAAQAELAVHTQKMENAMDRIVESLKDKQESNAAKARRLANALIRGLQSGNMDPQKFLAAAKALAAFINGLNLDGDFNLDNELAELNKHMNSASGLGRKHIDQPIDGILKNMKKPVQPVIEKKPPPQTFDEHIQAVADDIGNHLMLSDLGDGDPVTLLIRAIAAELSKLADAAKEGNRQNMVMAGRNACARINELHDLLKTYANRCRDPRTKERLLRAMQAMKNYSVQLKILTAVKAASGKNKDADTEEQLVNVAKSLGNALNESVTSVKVMKGGNLLR